jgi:hypothetical protein
MSAPPVAFYLVSDSRFFLGAVGTINSLRLVGHGEPVFVLDLGLTDEQCSLLDDHVTIVAAAGDAPPQLVKTTALRRHPAETMVLIDADIVVTRPLTELIERTAGDMIVAFRDREQRYFERWGELLGLGETRRQPYVSSGLVFLGGSVGAEVARLMDSSAARVDFSQTYWEGNSPDYPFLYADQDVLNAVLATRIEPDKIEALDQRLVATTPFTDVHASDERGLRCVYEDGTEPFALHHILPSKPWLRPMYDGLYSRLLKRLLVGEDLAIRVPRAMVPLRMRNGPLAYLERKRVDAAVKLRWHFGIALHRARARLGGLPHRTSPRRP